MATGEGKVIEKLKGVTECPVCLNTLTDPRVLPCIHTFCLECLRRIGAESKKKSAESIPCPICRKEFAIPAEGFEQIQKNFFMEHLIQLSNAPRTAESKTVLCDVCENMNDGTGATTPPAGPAEKYCADCRENLCGDCARRHKAQRLSRDHRVVEMGNDANEEVSKGIFFKPLTCDQHPSKILDYYCTECRRVVCVSCFVESHNSHKCSDVGKVSDGFRRAIARDIDEVVDRENWISGTVDRLTGNRERFLKEIAETERAIVKRNEDLKKTIDVQTRSLLDELNSIKAKRLKEMETEKEETETHLSILKSFKAYCAELVSKGTAGDVCRSVDEIHARTNELKEENDSYSSRSISSVHVSFRITREELARKYKTLSSYSSVLKLLNEFTDNIVGRLEACQSYLVVIGLPDSPDSKMSNDVLKIDLQTPNAVSKLDPHPRNELTAECASVVHDNTLYVIGIGNDNREIWKYGETSGWNKCGSLVQGRRRISAAFVEDTLYIAGGFVDSDQNVLSSVETLTADKCESVGELARGVYSAASVAYGSSMYVFGGYATNHKAVDYVQVYNKTRNVCTLSSKPLPRPCALMKAVSWEKSVILFSSDTCFAFDFEIETWQERVGFKTDVGHFGLILGNESVFVVGGRGKETDKDGNRSWKYRDDVRCIPIVNVIDNRPIEWKLHAKLAQPSRVYACGELKFPV